MVDPSPRDLPTVRVVVLNWNSAWLTARCLRSLAATDYPADRLEVVVVDNASVDGSRERIAHDFGHLRLIANPANLGFAEGCNRALRDLEGVDLVALVNNDATVEPGWLRPLVDAIDAAPDIGAACPRIVLETPFRDLVVDAGRGEATVGRVVVDGIDVTRRVLDDGLVLRSHPTLPLEFERWVRGSAVLHVPVPDAPGRTVAVEVTLGAVATPVTVSDAVGPAASVAAPAAAGSTVTVTVEVDAAGVRRINSMGTELTEWCEGTERRFGELDRGAPTEVHEVFGWSGGGVLLRTSLLAEIGIFDPWWFAYYEDTDLAWRSRRAGWRTVCVPAAAIHHLHGGTAGATARPFFFLNYRNWLLTALGNGSRSELGRAVRNAGHLSWPYFRRNVFGRVRRLQRPDFTITRAWARVFAGVAAAAPRVLARRFGGRRAGVVATDDVVSRWMPPSTGRAPSRRIGGPRLVYVDVSETLRSGWRAGIQRVTCEMVRRLPAAAPDLELVPICWAPLHQRFRRVTAEEYASLLAPTGRQLPAIGPVPPQPTWRRVAGRIGRLAGLQRLAERTRHARALAAEPPLHRELLLDRLEPGSVFLDLDASWNGLSGIRSELLPGLVASGIDVVPLFYDMLPITHPQWFGANLVNGFTAHVDALLGAASAGVAISRHTADEVRARARAIGVEPPELMVLPLAATAAPVDDDTAAPEIHQLDPAVLDRPFLLVVGTIEPRKNHLGVLDAWELVAAGHPGVDLVVVGRQGWKSDDTAARLRRLAATGRVHWLDAATDDELEVLYRRAHLVVVASFTEGFGLPVAEALARGAVVISSTGGALPEAGGDAVDYFDPDDPARLAELVARHLTDPEHHAERRAAATAAPRRTWAEVASELGGCLVDQGATSTSSGQLR